MTPRIPFNALLPDAGTEAAFRAYTKEELRGLLAAHCHDLARNTLAAGMVFGVTRITLIVQILLERDGP